MHSSSHSSDNYTRTHITTMSCEEMQTEVSQSGLPSSSAEVIVETPKITRTRLNRANRPRRLDLLNAPKKVRRTTTPVNSEPPIICQNIAPEMKNELKIRSDERGATIAYGDKWIYLSKEGFLNLKNIVNKIDDALQNSKENRWQLEKKIFASTKFWNNKMNVDIRVLVPIIDVDNGTETVKPTKCGVFLTLPMWNELKQNFHFHKCSDVLKSTQLGRLVITVLGEYLARIADPYIEQMCDGCVNNWPSQTDHVCCMDEDFHQNKRKNLSEHLKYLKSKCDIHYLTLRMAEAGISNGVELDRTPRYLMNKAIGDWSDELLAEIKRVQEKLIVHDSEGDEDADDDDDSDDTEGEEEKSMLS